MIFLVADLDSFQTRLGYQFRDVALLRLALTHSSVAHEHGGPQRHNQRLEYLGDSVLQLILTRELYDKFSAVGEGPLTKARAQLVNRGALADQGMRLGLGEQLLLSRGEESNGGRARPSILADAFEALLGAVFIDGGYDHAREFVLRRFQDSFGALEVIPQLANPKGELQELLQAQSPEAPQYQLESKAGPEHDRVFECAVRYRGEELGRGKGHSIKLAESAAALSALVQWRQRATGEPAAATAETQRT